MATAISKLVSFCILFYPYFRRKSMLHISLKYFCPTKEILYQIGSIGSASMFRSLLGVASGIALNNIAGGISDSVLAGIGVSTKIMMFPFSVFLGFGAGFQPVAGFNWGAKRFNRVRECYKFSSRVALIGSTAAGALMALFAPSIIGWFTTSDPEMLAIGALCIRLQCLALPIHAWAMVVNMFCAGLGYFPGAMLIATARQGSCFFPVLFPLAWLSGGDGVAASQAVADLLSLFLAIPIHRIVMEKVSRAEEEYRNEGKVLLDV